jgi:hypothetical protein
MLQQTSAFVMPLAFIKQSFFYVSRLYSVKQTIIFEELARGLPTLLRKDGYGC